MASLRDLFANMDQNATVTPVVFLAVFHMAFPRFAEKSQDGLVARSICKHGSKCFGGHYVVTLKNTEAEDEPETKSIEKFLHLSCFISNHEVKYLLSGLKYSISGESVTKFSPTLQKDCLYTKRSLINRLPAYLTIEIMRYEYKGKEAKILKEIKFSMNLDVFELCTPELQEKLSPMRTKFKEYEDKIVDIGRVPKSGHEGAIEKTEKPKFKHPYSFADDIGSNNSGYYDLQAVLTHKGRNIASGHNVGWIRKSKDAWYQCNDDNVNMVTTEDILKLSGGGDWHCAYLLLYGPRILESDEPF
ncbi:ubiquitin carboxyl-terminal hydrolase 14-like [Brevipalpus obovatus]|uniref:ubiquitin carboxyl-terminal hydrolase 14-like n=1 Tax=Brevipalpus obovatus TaxID=246614 RepID=UPI003D9E2C6A